MPRTLPAALVLLAALAACSATLTPQQKEELLAQADTALLSGSPAEAETAFRRVLKSEPSNARAAFGLGLAKLRTGRASEALGLFERAEQVTPGVADYTYLRAHTLALLNRREEALAAFEALLEEHPGHLPGTTGLVELLIEEERLMEAKTRAVAASQRFPRHYRLLFLAGRVHSSLAEWDASIPYYERARRIRPYSPQPVYGLIEAYRNTGRVPESLALIRVFEDLQSSGKELLAMQEEAAGHPMDPAPAERFIERLFENGWLDEAVEQTGIFLSQFPEAAAGGRFAARAARVAAQAGNAETARSLLQTAAARKERPVQEMVWMAEAYAALGDNERVTALHDEVMRGDPRDAAVLLGIGRATMRAGDLARAEPALRSAVAIAPSDAGARAALGLLLIRKGDRAGAAAELEAALRSDPEQHEALFGLGFLAQQAKRTAEAERYLRKAIAREPDDAGAQVILALVLSDSGNCEEALPLFTRLLEEDYRNLTLHLGLVRCLEQTGRTAEAERARKIAQEMIAP